MVLRRRFLPTSHPYDLTRPYVQRFQREKQEPRLWTDQQSTWRVDLGHADVCPCRWSWRYFIALPAQRVRIWPSPVPQRPAWLRANGNLCRLAVLSFGCKFCASFQNRKCPFFKSQKGFGLRGRMRRSGGKSGRKHGVSSRN